MNTGAVVPLCIPLVSCLRTFSGSLADPPEMDASDDPASEVLPSEVPVPEAFSGLAELELP